MSFLNVLFQTCHTFTISGPSVSVKKQSSHKAKTHTCAPPFQKNKSTPVTHCGPEKVDGVSGVGARSRQEQQAVGRMRRQEFKCSLRWREVKEQDEETGAAECFHVNDGGACWWILQSCPSRGGGWVSCRQVNHLHTEQRLPCTLYTGPRTHTHPRLPLYLCEGFTLNSFFFSFLLCSLTQTTVWLTLTSPQFIPHLSPNPKPFT